LRNGTGLRIACPHEQYALYAQRDGGNIALHGLSKVKRRDDADTIQKSVAFHRHSRVQCAPFALVQPRASSYHGSMESNTWAAEQQRMKEAPVLGEVIGQCFERHYTFQARVPAR
jgi:hypothetical protein